MTDLRNILRLFAHSKVDYYRLYQLPIILYYNGWSNNYIIIMIVSCMLYIYPYQYQLRSECISMCLYSIELTVVSNTWTLVLTLWTIPGSPAYAIRFSTKSEASIVWLDTNHNANSYLFEQHGAFKDGSVVWGTNKEWGSRRDKWLAQRDGKVGTVPESEVSNQPVRLTKPPMLRDYTTTSTYTRGNTAQAVLSSPSVSELFNILL